MNLRAERKAIRDFFEDTFAGKRVLSGALQPGSRVCGKKICSCHQGKLHPTRIVHAYTRRGKQYLRSIDEGKAAEAADAIRRYKAFLEILEEQVHRSRKELFPEFYSPSYQGLGFRRTKRVTEASIRDR